MDNGNAMYDIMTSMMVMFGDMTGRDNNPVRTIMMLVMILPKLLPLVSKMSQGVRQLVGRLSRRNVRSLVHVKTLYSSISYLSSGEAANSQRCPPVVRALMMAMVTAFKNGTEGSDAFAFEGRVEDVFEEAVVTKDSSSGSTLEVSRGIHLSSSFSESRESGGPVPVKKHEVVIMISIDTDIHPGNLKFSAIKAFVEACKTAYMDKQKDAVEGPHIFSMIDGDSTTNQSEDGESDGDGDDTASKRKKRGALCARAGDLKYFRKKLTDHMTNTPSFPEKEQITQMMVDFLNGADEYKRRGINHTLSIMLQSPPGCGKSRFFRYVATRLNLIIIHVSPNRVLTAETLHHLFRSDFVGGFSVPHNRRLYVVEDVDCSAWFNVLQERSGRPRSNSIRGMFNLDFYLNTMDGMVPRSGHIVIFTVNGDPKMFDSAVMRPGRIDAVVRLHRMSAAGIAQLYHQWFDEDLGGDIVARLRDNMYSVAEVTCVFRTLNKKEIGNRLLHMFPVDHASRTATTEKQCRSE